MIMGDIPPPIPGTPETRAARFELLIDALLDYMLAKVKAGSLKAYDVSVMVMFIKASGIPIVRHKTYQESLEDIKAERQEGQELASNTLPFPFPVDPSIQSTLQSAFTTTTPG